MTLNKSYSELIAIPDYKSRFEYLKCPGTVSEETFGFMRFLNQNLYSSKIWRNLRQKIIARDGGFDMAFEGIVADQIVIHHINPINVEDFENDNPLIWEPENLICVDKKTHQALHYGNFELIRPMEVVERRPFDTCPWR